MYMGRGRRRAEMKGWGRTELHGEWCRRNKPGSGRLCTKAGLCKDAGLTLESTGSWDTGGKQGGEPEEARHSEKHALLIFINALDTQ